MQSKMKDRVTVFAVSTDEDGSAYQKFLREQHISLLTVRDAEKKSSIMYGTFGYPETYIIDAKGVLRRKLIGPVDWMKPEMIDYLQKL